VTACVGPSDRTSLAYVTLHEMFYIFQIFDFVEY